MKEKITMCLSLLVICLFACNHSETINKDINDANQDIENVLKKLESKDYRVEPDDFDSSRYKYDPNGTTLNNKSDTVIDFLIEQENNGNASAKPVMYPKR